MDRISNLSDDLLLKIVSSLPTKNVVATMVLSKRWRFLWTMLPKLDFDYGTDLEPSQYGKYIKYVDRSLVLNRAPVLETLKFKVGPCCSSEDLATWIRMGMVHHVRELEIYHYHRSIELPKSLYTYEKLEVLKLATYSIILDVPSDVCFPSLKTLHLICVAYKTKESHRMLLSGCPVLEELVLDKTDNWDILQPLYVEVPTLQRLSILDTFDVDDINEGDNGPCKIVINVPSLKYLNFVDLYGNLCLFENMPEVVEAIVKVVYESPEKLLESLPSVKRLSLCLYASMMQLRIGFDHLVDLMLCASASGWWDLLTWMLESSPKLQVLKLCSCKEHYVPKPIEGHWNGPSSVPECLMFHLHTFKWKDYNLKDKEKNIVAYILKNARQLKTAYISEEPSYHPKKERSKRLNELVSLPRASSSCQLILK